MKQDFLPRIVLFSLLLFAIFLPLGYWFAIRSKTDRLELHARMAEDGGWSIQTIHAKTGQPLQLHITSDDVVHGFAIGKSNQPSLEILPGEYTDTSLTFDHPGVYTFYCTRWCGKDHWRMRGKIEVSGPGTSVTPDTVPLYITLGIDIDAPHFAKVVPAVRPSSVQGAQYADLLPAYATSRDTYVSTSPADLWLRLRSEPSLSKLSDGQIWDAVRWVWGRQTDSSSLGSGLKLFLDLAAAAHGVSGKGDGVMVRGLPLLTHENMGNQRVRPPDFTDPHQLLGASPALLQGKIIRGGMGTGMPSWGAILTSEQIDAIVGYLYTIAWNALPEQAASSGR